MERIITIMAFYANIEKSMKRNILLSLMIFWGIFLVEISMFSCNSTDTVTPRYLFSLRLGVLPGEFKQWSKSLKVKVENHFVTKSGIFYLANGDRILKISSNGYLLDYIANDPVLNRESGEGANSITIQNNESSIPFVAYPLDKVNALSVDSKGRIIMVNTVFDSNLSEAYFTDDTFANNNHLLIYDKGNIRNTIVQDGEGKISSAVKELYIQKDDSIVLITREPTIYMVYIMDSGGRLSQKIAVPIYKYPDITGQLDNEKGEKSSRATLNQAVNVIGVLKNVVPSYQKKYLYVQVNYYKQIQESDGDPLEIDFLSTKVFRIDMERNVYDREVPIPVAYAKDNLNLLQINKKEQLVLVRYFTDTTGDNNEKLDANQLRPTIFFINQDGKKKRELRLDMPDITFYDYMFDVDEEGNVAGYFVLLDRVEFYWWEK